MWHIVEQLPYKTGTIMGLANWQVINLRIDIFTFKTEFIYNSYLTFSKAVEVSCVYTYLGF